MKLNDTKCKNAKPFPPPKKTPRKLADGDGLYLWVMPNGKKYWRFKYRYSGKQRELAIGVYPEISLKEARNKRLEARKLLEMGKDPSLEKQKQKILTEQKNSNTFESISREWYANRKSKWKQRYADEVINRLEKDIFPAIGAYPITDIEPPLLLRVIRKIESRGAYELAKRELQKCGEIFRYAIACGKAIRDPSADIREALKPVKKEHYAAIDINDLPEFLHALTSNKGRLYAGTQNAIWLIMLTFVRTSELINATWNEISLDNEEWIIPAERMKMGKDHIVPLSKQAITLLHNQKAIAGHWPLIFPSNVRPKQPISNNTILGALKRLGYQGRMTGHGFRALAMSGIKEKLGYRHEVIDRQLAHGHKNKINAAYDRAMFLDERRKMMQEWADYIDSVNAQGKQS